MDQRKDEHITSIRLYNHTHLQLKFREILKIKCI